MVSGITGPDPAALYDTGEQAFPGHDALTDLAEYRTSFSMTLLSDLGDLEFDGANTDSVEHRDHIEIPATEGDVFREFAGEDLAA
jgi:hypothetical protein